jgi:rhamnulokinase
MTTAHLAIDLGAGSGRTIVGLLDVHGNSLKMEEVHRFEHLPCPTPAGPVWDLTGIWLNILQGLRNGQRWCHSRNLEISSVGVDAWGVDWCLVGRSGELLALPHCYRDPQNEVAMEQVLQRVGGKERLYERNGIQLMQINTLFQVAARHQKEPGLFEVADRLLFVPDLFHFWLSGHMATERTIASTSAMLHIETGNWDFELLERLGIPTHMLGEISEPGTVLGHLRPEVADLAEIEYEVQVVLPASHDTASAVTAIPVGDSEKTWAYLSSGTWSLLGAELDRPFVSPKSCDAPFTNELGINGTVRFLKNIAGLWLLQELRRELERRDEPMSHAELADQARNADPFRTLIDPNDHRFASPGNMGEKIREFARETEQPEPETIGDLVRCCLESLALCYRETIELLETTLDLKVELLHVVGGGIRNEFLNELTAMVMKRPVLCGPIEATAIGNLLVQALGCGEIQGVQQLRQTVVHSFAMEKFDGQSREEDDELLEAAYQRFQRLLKD